MKKGQNKPGNRQNLNLAKIAPKSEKFMKKSPTDHVWESLNYKSGLRILIRTSEVPFFLVLNMDTFGKNDCFWTTKNGTSGAQIKILRPLYSSNSPQIRLLGLNFMK